MNYFEAKKAEDLFNKYKELTQRYWSVASEDSRDHRAINAGVSISETKESFELREEINQMYADVNIYAYKLGIGIQVQSYPAPAVGGPVLPVNILASVVNRNKGHRPISKDTILDKINQCVGAAKSAKHKGFWRLVLPWYWLIDIPALVLRIPFLILEEAGVPEKVEENIISHILKVIIVILFLLLVGYLGLEKYIPDLVKVLK